VVPLHIKNVNHIDSIILHLIQGKLLRDFNWKSSINKIKL